MQTMKDQQMPNESTNLQRPSSCHHIYAEDRFQKLIYYSGLRMDFNYDWKLHVHEVSLNFFVNLAQRTEILELF